MSTETIANTPELREEFHLIVASSVCAFVPDYKATIQLLRSMLAPGGYFVQWDWELTDTNTEYGLSGETISSALQSAGFENVFVSRPFTMKAEDTNEAQVIMGIAKA